LEFAEGAFEKVLANLELCWHSQGELLTLKTTDEYSHLIAISVVRPGYATTPHPIFPIGQATKNLPIGEWQERGGGGKMMQNCSKLLFPTVSCGPLVAHTLLELNTFALFSPFLENFW
jgi:hypothetical protein